MGTIDLFGTFQFLARFTNEKTINNVKKRLSIGFFQIQQTTIVVRISFWTGKTHERRILHGQNRNNDFVKKRRINMSGFIHNNDISSCSTRSLRERGKKKALKKGLKEYKARSRFFFFFFNIKDGGNSHSV